MTTTKRKKRKKTDPARLEQWISLRRLVRSAPAHPPRPRILVPRACEMSGDAWGPPCPGLDSYEMEMHFSALSLNPEPLTLEERAEAAVTREPRLTPDKRSGPAVVAAAAGETQ